MTVNLVLGIRSLPARPFALKGWCGAKPARLLVVLVEEALSRIPYRDVCFFLFLFFFFFLVKFRS